MSVFAIAVPRVHRRPSPRPQLSWRHPVFAAALFLASTSPAVAAPPAACAQDISKHCSNVPQAGAELVICLQTHASELQPECAKALKQKHMSSDTRRTRRNKQVKPWMTACVGDVQKLCTGIPAGRGRVAECLTQHQAQLSDGCKAAFPPKRN